MIRFWARWVSVVTAGELAGFAVPAATAVGVAALAPGWQWLALVAAGAAEGALLGLAQAAVLTRVLPALDRVGWVVNTSIAAAFAWALGMLPSTTYPWWVELPRPLLSAVGFGLGLAVLLSIGVAQWLVLRRYVARCRAWIVITAAAWLVGLTALTAVTTPLWQAGQSQVVIAAIGLVGGLGMAATMAAVTGLGMLRLLGPRLDAPVGVGAGRW